MTSTLAPSPLMGSAPPANATPGVQGTGPHSKSASTRPEGESPQESFATLLQTATTTTTGGADERDGGEKAPLPQGGTPSLPEGAPDVTELLARLMALAQGLQDEGVPTGPTESTETTLLLDRLAEAGGLEAQDPQADGASALDLIEAPGTLDAMGAMEALMTYLVMGQQTPSDPDAMTALPDDLVALLQQIEGGAEGVATDLELAARQAVQAAIDLTSGEPTVSGTAASDAIADIPEVTPVDAEGAESVTSPVSDLVATPVTEPATEGVRNASSEAATEVRGDARPNEVAAVASEGVATAPAPSEVDRAGVADASTRPTAASTSGGTGAEMVAGVAGGQPQAAAPVVETGAATRVVNASTLPAEVADTVRVAAFRGDAEVRLVLNPPDLGHLDIHISRGENGLRIVMEASQAGARELLDRSITGLHQALEARDLRVDRLEVRATDTGRGSLDTSAGGQQSGGGAFHGGAGEDAPEWSPVAMLESMSNAAGVGQSEQTTAGDASTLSGSVAGSVDVLA